VDSVIDVEKELHRIAFQTTESITLVEAELAREVGPLPHQQGPTVADPSYPGCHSCMALPLPTDAVIDYLSITHRNIYRLPITPDQRCILKKYLRLIEAEIDENRGVPGPSHPCE